MLPFLLAIALVTLAFYNFYWKRKCLPPGPTPLPLIGNALSIGVKKPPYDVLLKWKDQYGPIYTYWFGETPVVAVNDFNLLKDTFIKDGETYTGRNFFTEFQKMMRDGKLAGVLSTEGDLWRDQRRFTLHVLRNFGMGRTIIEDIIMVEVNRLITLAQQGIGNGEKEHDLAHIVEICVGSIINKMMFGYRFEGETESEFYHLKSLLQDNGRIIGNPITYILMLNPKVIKNLPYFDKLYKRMMTNVTEIKAFLDRQIEWNRKRFSKEGNPDEATNYVQAYLMEMHKRQESGNVGDFTFVQLRNMCLDLWIAGQETTTSTTCFGILYIMTHPEVQKKMQDELDKIVGDERQVSLNDRPNLPYMNAVCNETQRLCNLLPQNLFHTTTKDVTINGYKIKKGTTIVPQISCVLYGDKTFPNPDQFIPERFLDENGKLKRVEELVPFSVGKRQCLGESMAKNELFLFLANLFHEYRVIPSDKNQTLEKISGFTVQPPAFKCHLERRIPIVQ